MKGRRFFMRKPGFFMGFYHFLPDDCQKNEMFLIDFI